jgi:hypothetical protein
MISHSQEDKICMEDVRTTLYSTRGISLSINGHSLKSGDEISVKELFVSAKVLSQTAKNESGPLVLGKIMLHLNQGDALSVALREGRNTDPLSGDGPPVRIQGTSGKRH